MRESTEPGPKASTPQRPFSTKQCASTRPKKCITLAEALQRCPHGIKGRRSFFWKLGVCETLPQPSWPRSPKDSSDTGRSCSYQDSCIAAPHLITSGCRLGRHCDTRTGLYITRYISEFFSLGQCNSSPGPPLLTACCAIQRPDAARMYLAVARRLSRSYSSLSGHARNRRLDVSHMCSTAEKLAY